jgi:hypothetical protein
MLLCYDCYVYHIITFREKIIAWKLSHMAFTLQVTKKGTEVPTLNTQYFWQQFGWSNIFVKLSKTN